LDRERRWIVEDVALIVASVALAVATSRSSQWQDPALLTAFGLCSYVLLFIDTDVAGVRFQSANMVWVVAAATTGPAPAAVVSALTLVTVRWNSLPKHPKLNNLAMTLSCTTLAGGMLLAVRDWGDVTVNSDVYLVAVVFAAALHSAWNAVVILRVRAIELERSTREVFRTTIPPALPWEALSCVLAAVFSGVVITYGLAGAAFMALTALFAPLVIRRALLSETQARENAELLIEAEHAEWRIRREMAEVLHDDTLQTMMAARQDIEDAVRGDTARLTAADAALATSVVQIRSLLGPLFEDVQSGTLGDRLLGLRGDLQARTRLSVTVHVDESCSSLGTEPIYRCARELASNAARHSGGTTIEIRLLRTETHAILSVADDGIGPPSVNLHQLAGAGHLGLALIDRRALAHGGTFELGPGEPRGTVATLRIPWANLATAEL
jgi:signal transduction histidine kinase